MAQVEATTERIVAADAETVFDALADYSGTRSKVMPEQFSEYEVREGGDGEGTLVHWKLQATSKRVRDCLLEVSEPTDGELVEKDRNSSMVTTWRVTPMRRGHVEGRRHQRLDRSHRHRRLLRADLRPQGPRPHLRRPPREARHRGGEVGHSKKGTAQEATSRGALTAAPYISPVRVDLRPVHRNAVTRRACSQLSPKAGIVR